MKNRLFSVLTVLLMSLPLMNCGLPPGSVEGPLDDPQQARLPEEVKGNTKKTRIEDIAYSPDGTILAVAAGNGIWLYDAQTGQELAQCSGHIKKVLNIAFRPDGGTLVSVGIAHEDQSIRIWDVHTGKNLRTFRYYAWDAAFSPDGKTIVCGGSPHKVYLLDADTGKLIRTFTGHEGSGFHVQNVAFSPDGKTIAGMGLGPNRSLCVWDANTGKLLQTFTDETPEGYYLRNFAFCPDSSMIASWSDPSTISLWDVHTGKRLRAITGIQAGYGWYKSLVFSPDGKMIVGKKGLDIVLRDVNTGKLLRRLTGYREKNPLRRDRFNRYIWDDPTFIFLVFNPDGKTIAAASRDCVHLWDVNTGYLRKIIQF